MALQEIDPLPLQRKALQVLSTLKEVASRRERFFSPDIEAVLVFSGPGDYYQRLKPGEVEWMRWMDRDRVRAGVAVVREVTVARIRRDLGSSCSASQVTGEAISQSGPYFVYNGIPEENAVIRSAIDSPSCLVPKDKIVIFDTARNGDGSLRPIRHTGDQVESFYQAVASPDSPLFGISTVACVAHIPDYVRIPFYLRKNDEMLAQVRGCGLSFWFYALRSRPHTEEPHTQSELPRLVAYAGKGDLATDPMHFRV